MKEKKLYYTYSQNNTGGIFDEDVGRYVIVQACSSDVANDLAEPYAEVYFDGCESGRDCSCCGDRWYRQWDNDGEKLPEVYGSKIPKAVLNSKLDMEVRLEKLEKFKKSFDKGISPYSFGDVRIRVVSDSGKRTCLIDLSKNDCKILDC